jgi:hypothetical protein
MRAKLILATLFGLFLCSLATLEITELSRLVDDTSNDFSLPHSGAESSSAAVGRNCDLQSGSDSYPRYGCEQPRVWGRATGSSQLTKDFFHLLCVMRI